MRRSKIAAVVALLAIPSAALADTGPVAPAKCKVPMTVYSPCEGTLLPYQEAKEGLLCLVDVVPKLKLEMSRKEELFAVERAALKREAEIERKRGNEHLKIAERAISSKREPENVWEKPHVAYPLGVVLGGAVATVVAVLLQRTR